MTSVAPNSSAFSIAILHAAGDVRGIRKVITAASVGTIRELADGRLMAASSR
jgi:hypothetical protein